MFKKIETVENCNSNDLKNEIFWLLKRRLWQWVSHPTPIWGMRVLLWILFERRRWEEKAGCWRGASAGGRCAGDIDRNIKVSSVKTKENMDFALLMQLSTFQLFLEFLFIFFKFADERSRELKRPATRCHVKDDKDLFR